MVLSQGEWDFGKYFYFILFLGGEIFLIFLPLSFLMYSINEKKCVYIYVCLSNILAL